MELINAIELIKPGIPEADKPQRWIELGAGDGLFTKALASLLPPQSSILAVDQQANALQSISLKPQAVTIQIQVGNFIELGWGKEWDGVLMANALHYVSDVRSFLVKLKSTLLPSGRLVIVEYERRQANAWVPYPIDFLSLKKIGNHAGFTSIEKLRETPSLFGSASIYSAVLI
jgi:ubiquinone/menaquinone biosynthesis C-methylase UbiE